MLGEVRRGQKPDKLSLITDFVITHLGFLNLTPDVNLLTAAFYVLFRSQHPDKATVKDVLKELKKNHIDVCQLAEYSRYHCQWGEQSMEETPLRVNGLKDRKKLCAILSILDEWIYSLYDRNRNYT